MLGHFDIKKFCSIVHHSKTFFSSSTSPIDIATYYCNTNIVCLDDKQKKINWIKYILNKKKKKGIQFNMKSDDFDLLAKFINSINY